MSVLLGCVGLTAAACSDSDGSGASGPEEVVEDHIRLSRDFDLQGDCELRSPAAIEAMALADHREPDSYCEFAVAEAVRLADDETRARTRRLYTEMEVVERSRDEDRAVYELISADGAHAETVEVEKVDGRWYIASITDEETEEAG